VRRGRGRRGRAFAVVAAALVGVAVAVFRASRFCSRHSSTPDIPVQRRPSHDLHSSRRGFERRRSRSANRAPGDSPPLDGKRPKNLRNDRQASVGAERSIALSTRSSCAVAHAATPMTARATAAYAANNGVRLLFIFTQPAIAKQK
jgi:hypothetical protein